MRSANTADSNYNNASATARLVLTVQGKRHAPEVWHVNPTSLTITEGGSTSYSVVLTKAADGDCEYVDISGASDDVRVNRTTTAEFSTSNWNREQSVTVSVAEDDDAGSRRWQ